MFRILSG